MVELGIKSTCLGLHIRKCMVRLHGLQFYLFKHCSSLHVTWQTESSQAICYHLIICNYGMWTIYIYILDRCNVTHSLVRMGCVLSHRAAVTSLMLDDEVRFRRHFELSKRFGVRLTSGFGALLSHSAALVTHQLKTDCVCGINS